MPLPIDHTAVLDEDLGENEAAMWLDVISTRPVLKVKVKNDSGQVFAGHVELEQH